MLECHESQIELGRGKARVYVLMKILESAPSRYDRGIKLLTLGRLDALYDRAVSHIEEGQRVLDLGCGTGTLSLKAARRGAQVIGIDINPDMLEIARKKAEEAGLKGLIDFQEKGVGELSEFPPESFDVVISGLCFSELPPGERNYALWEIHRLLKPGGLLIIVDEAEPSRLLKRLLLKLMRAPLALFTFIVTQTTTRALRDFPRKVAGAGFRVESIRYHGLGDLMEIVARKEDGTHTLRAGEHN